MLLTSRFLDRVFFHISICSFFYFFVGAGLSFAGTLPLQETMLRGLYLFAINWWVMEPQFWLIFFFFLIYAKGLFSFVTILLLPVPSQNRTLLIIFLFLFPFPYIFYGCNFWKELRLSSLLHPHHMTEGPLNARTNNLNFRSDLFFLKLSFVHSLLWPVLQSTCNVLSFWEGNQT